MKLIKLTKDGVVSGAQPADTAFVPGDGVFVPGKENHREQPLQVRNEGFVPSVPSVPGKKEDIYITENNLSDFSIDDEDYAALFFGDVHKDSFAKLSPIKEAYSQNTGNTGNNGNLHENKTQKPGTEPGTEPGTKAASTPKVIEYDAQSLVPRPPLPRHLWQSGIADYGQAWRVWQELRKDYFAAMGKHESGYYINDTITSGFVE